MKFFLFISVIFYSLNIFAQDKVFPIDIQMDICLHDESTSSTVATNGCVNIAINSWLAEIELSLDSLREILSPESFHVAYKAQLKWEQYLKAEDHYLSQLYSGFMGKLYTTEYRLEILELVKKRAILLNDHYQTQMEQQYDEMDNAIR